jgi:uncharacterized protein (TIGR02145 family)
MAGSPSSSASPSSVRGICPSGWHVPSDTEWEVLVNYVGGDSTAGTKLKSTSGWSDGGNGTDDYGFSALPGGGRFTDGIFWDVGTRGYWWSASEFDANFTWDRRMYSDRSLVTRFYWFRGFGISLRCVRD